MNKILVAYWHRDGLDIYSLRNGKPAKVAAGALDSLQPVKRGLGVKALIVGREQLMHLRKRYPPASREKLTAAANLEAKELFPLTKPALYCRVFRSFSNYVELDIWAWETESTETLKAIFPFSHVIPEDVLYYAGEPEVHIFQQGGLVHLLAHGQGGFLDSASVPLAGFDEGQMERFLFNLNQSDDNIKSIKVYGLPQVKISNLLGLKLARISEVGYPHCLTGMAQVNLKEFKVRGAYHYLPEPAVMLRICLYLILGYGLLLFITLGNYDRTSAEIRRKIAEMDKKALRIDASQGAVDYTDAIREVNASLQAGPRPLAVINMLAERLPEGTFVNRMALTATTLELRITAKEPLTVVKSLGSDKMVKKVTLKGSPSRDKGKGVSSFTVTLELVT